MNSNLLFDCKRWRLFWVRQTNSTLWFNANHDKINDNIKMIIYLGAVLWGLIF